MFVSGLVTRRDECRADGVVAVVEDQLRLAKFAVDADRRALCHQRVNELPDDHLGDTDVVAQHTLGHYTPIVGPKPVTGQVPLVIAGPGATSALFGARTARDSHGGPGPEAGRGRSSPVS